MLKSVNRLIVVAAPSCCGKTVFLGQLAGGAMPEVAAAIGIDDVAQWHICDANWLPQIQHEQIDSLILAYAIPANDVISGLVDVPSNDSRLGIVSVAREVAFVTLLASSRALTSRLRDRHRASIRRFFLNPRKFARTREMLKRLLPVYSSPAQLREIYDWWFRFTATVPNRGHWVVNADENYVLRGWFRRMKSIPGRGMWVANAQARYELHDSTVWSQVLTEINAPST